MSIKSEKLDGWAGLPLSAKDVDKGLDIRSMERERFPYTELYDGHHTVRVYAHGPVHCWLGNARAYSTISVPDDAIELRKAIVRIKMGLEP